MVEVFSESPGLLVTSPYVQFKGGRALVDAATAERLRAITWAGISVPGPVKPTRAPSKKASSK